MESHPNEAFYLAGCCSLFYLLLLDASLPGDDFSAFTTGKFNNNIVFLSFLFDPGLRLLHCSEPTNRDPKLHFFVNTSASSSNLPTRQNRIPKSDDNLTYNTDSYIYTS